MVNHDLLWLMFMQIASHINNVGLHLLPLYPLHCFVCIVFVFVCYVLSFGYEEMKLYVARGRST